MMILLGGADGNWRPEPTTGAVVRLTGIASRKECVFPPPASSPPLVPLLENLTGAAAKEKIGFAESQGQPFRTAYRTWVGMGTKSLITSIF